jgi:acyl dehydratase
MRRFATIAEVLQARGEDLGLTDWVRVDQARIQLFADATGDHNWIHIDPDRAARSRYGGTIGHGFLTLALIAPFSLSLLAIDEAPVTVNYGLNKVRFPSPVPAGARVRARAELADAIPLPSGVRLVIRYTMHSDAGDKPACVAEHVSVRFTS